MRHDENGKQCPATLGEYRDICAALFGGDSESVRFLDGKISESAKARDEEVAANDSQMRLLLFSLQHGRQR